MGEEEYPAYVLTAKRPMTDFTPTTGTTKHQSKPADATAMAFVETKNRGDFNPVCYCCRTRHPGRYLECHNVTDVVAEHTLKAVDAGHFQ